MACAALRQRLLTIWWIWVLVGCDEDRFVRALERELHPLAESGPAKLDRRRDVRSPGRSPTRDDRSLLLKVRISATSWRPRRRRS